MITFLIGENSFEIEREIARIIDNFDGNAEKIDGSELQLPQLPDILMGVSLFATARLVIIRNLSANKTIWPILVDWISKISDDIHLVLIEPKPDMRTSTFKVLKKESEVHEFNLWTDRDVIKAEQWAALEAKSCGFELDKKCAQTLVQRVGLDQWELFYAIEKLSSVETVTVEVINDVIELSPSDNVFNLFEMALRGDVVGFQKLLRSLEQSQEVYPISSLLFSQGFQLMAIASAEDSDNVAKDFGVHPYVVSKLTPIAKRLGKNGVAKIVKIFAEADDDMKTSRADLWFLVERALMKIANI